jgi:hypothetical protein
MKSMKIFLVLSLAIIIALPLSCMAGSAKCRHHHKRKKESVFVPYVNAATNTNLEVAFTINVGFNNDPSPHPFIMDTGSCGIVATPDYFKPAPDAQNLGPGETFYDSSGITEKGTFWTATQQIYDPQGNLLATANVPVLQVTEVCVTAPDGTTTCNPNPTGIALMGIGFGREGTVLPLKTPAYNAFLNLTSVMIKGKLRPLPRNWVNGYVVYPFGVALGLTPQNTAKAGLVKLQPWPQYSTEKLPEWMPTTMTVDVNGTSGDGQSIMDTGITFSILTAPSGANLGTLVPCPVTSSPKCLPNGDTISVYFPDQTNPVAFYTFTTGQQGNPMQPDYITTAIPHPTVFWNTSRHLIGGMNFVYDNKNGYCGYIWNGNTSSDFGYVIPTKK